MPDFDDPLPSPTLDTGSPHFPTFPLSCRVKRTSGDNISAAERAILDAAKGRLILPRNKRLSLHERSAMVKGALEKKKAALLLLTAAQRDLEKHCSFMVEDQGLEETIRFYDTHYDIGDHENAVGRYMKTVSSVTFMTCAVPKGKGQRACLT